MDHETSKPDSSAWVDDRIASLKSSGSWTPDTDRAYRELSQRTARPAGVPWLRLSLAGVTVTALVLVVAMLPWSQVWKPSETTAQTAEPTQAAQAEATETTVENLGTLEVRATFAEPQPAVAPPESTSVAAKNAEAGFAETAQRLTSSPLKGSPENRCKKTYNCQPMPGTGLAAAQDDERTRLERQKIEEARSAGIMASSAASPPFQPSPQGVTQPVVIHQVTPAYTEEAKNVRIQGTVIVDVTVTTDGSVVFEGYRQKLGYGLDENAVAAVLQWRFKPGTKDGTPVATRVSLSMHFSLK